MKYQHLNRQIYTNSILIYYRFRCTVDHLQGNVWLLQWELLRALSIVTYIPRAGIKIRPLHPVVSQLELDFTNDKWPKEVGLLQRSFENRKAAEYTRTSTNLLTANKYVSFRTFQGRFIIVFTIKYDVTGPTHHSSFCCWQQYLPWTPCFSETKNKIRTYIYILWTNPNSKLC
jgi:hypothetical protein